VRGREHARVVPARVVVRAARRLRPLRAELGAAAVAALAWAVTLLVPPWSDDRFTDVPLYAEWSQAFLSGGLPYRDIAFEYPPLAAPALALAGVLGTGDATYELAFAVLCLGLLLAVMALAGRLAGRAGSAERTRAMLAVALVPLLTGALVRTHFDLLPVAFAVGALLALVRRRPMLGFALIGLGAAAKGFPLAMAPVALAWLWGGGERREAARGAFVLVAVLATAVAAAAALAPGGALDAARYQLERPVQVESVPATVLNALDALGGREPRTVASHRADGLAHPAADAVAAGIAAAGVGALVLLAAGASFARGDPRALVLAALAAMVVCAACARVLSPQFVLWTIPLLAVALAWRKIALAGAVTAAIALTFAWFPVLYEGVVGREPALLALVAARNAAMLAAVLLVLRVLAVGRPLGRASPAQGRYATAGVGVREP
jgi:hypothetical protein